MKKPKPLPLSIADKRRSDDCIAKIENAKLRLIAEMHTDPSTAKLQRNGAVMKLSEFEVYAGLGRGFFYGDKHKLSTKPKTEEFLIDLGKAVLAARGPTPKSATPAGLTSRDRELQLENEALREKVRRLQDLVLFSRIRLHELRRENSNLQARLPTKIVKLKT